MAWKPRADFADNRRGVLIVRATKEDFAKVDDLAKKFDVPAEPSDNRIVRVEYVDANQVCDVIRQLMGGQAGGFRPPDLEKALGELLGAGARS